MNSNITFQHYVISCSEESSDEYLPTVYSIVSACCTLYRLICFLAILQRRRHIMTLTRWALVVTLATMAACGAVDKRQAPTEGDYADRSSDGSYAFRYADKNQFHSAAANKDNVVSGRYSYGIIS